jgi:hypothetical protein
LRKQGVQLTDLVALYSECGFIGSVRRRRQDEADLRLRTSVVKHKRDHRLTVSISVRCVKALPVTIE